MVDIPSNHYITIFISGNLFFLLPFMVQCAPVSISRHNPSFQALEYFIRFVLVEIFFSPPL